MPRRVLFTILIISGLIIALFPVTIQAVSVPGYNIPPTPEQELEEAIIRVIKIIITIFFWGPLIIGVILELISLYIKLKNKKAIDTIEMKRQTKKPLSPAEMAIERLLKMLNRVIIILAIMFIASIFFFAIFAYCC